MIRKLLLKCELSPGDIVMLTAAVRDLHACYPGRFLTDVRTSCPDLWSNNPYISPLSERDPEVEVVDCRYPLIDRCNDTPYHCLHGFIEFLNDRLSLAIKPTAFKGDVHLSPQEKAWYSQVHELTRREIPFWIVAAGGKYDITIKWWDINRFQKVVDYFQGKIQFVQVGEWGHHHSKLNGVIDLRGKTSLRELVRLIHHSQGVLCSITALMHLAAAVESKPGSPQTRACVVIAGGREPAHWEAYPHHQFIHTNGTLACSAQGGCWKDRVIRLKDGDERDHPNNLCVDVVDKLPRCMEMITSEEVIRRIELFFNAKVIKYLSPIQRKAAENGVNATVGNAYDRQPLTLSSAGLACDRFVESIPVYPDCYRGRGIVICGGGQKYFTNAWISINTLRHLGCRLPIQLWHFGRAELGERMRDLLAPLGVACIDAQKTRKRFPARMLSGWALKPYAILHSPFQEVMLLDADNVPVRNPEYLFDAPQFHQTGAIFWPDYDHDNRKKAKPVWRSSGLRQPREPEFESGQMVLDKRRVWAALRLCLWFNENSDFYYQFLHGDKETFHLAFRKMKKNYSLISKPLHPLKGTMCQHDFDGRRLFQHRNTAKWKFLGRNARIKDFWLESECRQFLAELKRKWNGRIN